VYASNKHSDYPAFLEFLDGVLKGAPSGDFTFLLEDFSAHVGNDEVTWRGVIGRNDLPDLNLSCVLFFDFCTNMDCPLRMSIR